MEICDNAIKPFHFGRTVRGGARGGEKDLDLEHNLLKKTTPKCQMIKGRGGKEREK